MAMNPDEPASQSEEKVLPDGNSAGNDDIYADRGQWHDDVWKYVVGPEDIVVQGALYDGTQWEHDGEGGVRPRLHSEEEIEQRRQEGIREGAVSGGTLCRKLQRRPRRRIAEQLQRNSQAEALHRRAHRSGRMNSRRN
jgi:hypothetical protein